LALSVTAAAVAQTRRKLAKELNTYCSSIRRTAKSNAPMSARRTTGTGAFLAPAIRRRQTRRPPSNQAAATARTAATGPDRLPRRNHRRIRGRPVPTDAAPPLPAGSRGAAPASAALPPPPLPPDSTAARIDPNPNPNPNPILPHALSRGSLASSPLPPRV